MRNANPKLACRCLGATVLALLVSCGSSGPAPEAIQGPNSLGFPKAAVHRDVSVEARFLSHHASNPKRSNKWGLDIDLLKEDHLIPIHFKITRKGNDSIDVSLDTLDARLILQDGRVLEAFSVHMDTAMGRDDDYDNARGRAYRGRELIDATPAEGYLYFKLTNENFKLHGDVQIEDRSQSQPKTMKIQNSLLAFNIKKEGRATETIYVGVN
tara:strand:+ start:27086 stop:27721 length:636 start_codon:yes stop_codon:yes gene_type:complete